MQKNIRRWDKHTFLVTTVYFVQGAVIVAGLSEFLLTRNAFQFSWIQLSLLAALSVLTWSIKPIYGFLTDLLPLFGSRRRNYLILSSLFPIAGYFYLAFFGTSFLQIALAVIVANIGLGFADVIADGIVVEHSTPRNVGWYQAICWRAKAVGIFFGSLFSGFLLERAVFSSWLANSSLPTKLTAYFPAAFPEVSPIPGLNMLDIRFTFLLTGLIPVITLVLAFLWKEKKVSKKILHEGQHDISPIYLWSAALAFVLTILSLVFISSVATPILAFISNEALSSLLVITIWSIWILFYALHLVKVKASTSVLLWSALFLFLWRFTPSFGAPWSNYFLNTLELSQERLGYIATLSPLAWIIGSFLYTRFFDKFQIKKVLFWTVIISASLSLSQLSVASADFGTAIGETAPVKYTAAVLLMPTYAITSGFSAWETALAQDPLLNVNAILTFLLEIVFIIAFLPLLKLAALVTPEGVEATNFAVLMSVMNLGMAFGGITGGFIYTYIEGTYSIVGLSYTGLHLTILIGAITSLICLPVLWKMKVSHMRH